MMAPRLTRTYLAVPAHRARLVQNAAASAADAVFLDLEDAVPLAEKAAALDAAAQALTVFDWGRKTVAVRLNATDSSTIEREIQRLAGLPRLDAVILPKAERVGDITTLAGRLTACRGERRTPVEIELLIETALGMVNVDELAAADPLVTALHLGVGDFAASIGARSPEIGTSPPRLQACRRCRCWLSGNTTRPLRLSYDAGAGRGAGLRAARDRRSVRQLS